MTKHPNAKATFDEICEEVLCNARLDRARLEAWADAGVKSPEGIDPAVAAELAMGLVNVAEALTKNNAQLVLLATLKLKEKSLGKPAKAGEDDALDDDEKSSTYDVIEGGKGK